jgi:hypothetical protein
MASGGSAGVGSAGGSAVLQEVIKIQKVSKRIFRVFMVVPHRNDGSGPVFVKGVGVRL